LPTGLEGHCVKLVQRAASAVYATAEGTGRKARSNRTETFDRELSAAERLSVGTDFPDRLSLHCAPYPGFVAQPINCSLRADDADGAAMIVLRFDGDGALQESLSDELLDLLQPADTKQHRVLRGRYSPGIPDDDAETVAAYLRARTAGKPRGLACAVRGLPDSALNELEWQALTYTGHTVWGMHAERQGGAAKGPCAGRAPTERSPATRTRH
jgi:hypothetical protein